MDTDNRIAFIGGRFRKLSDCGHVRIYLTIR